MQFPRTHLFLLGALSIGMCTFVVAKFTDDPSAQRFSNATVLSSLTVPTDALPDEILEPEIILAGSPDLDPPVAPEPEPPKWRQVNAKVQRGDNLALIFKRHGLTPADVHAVAQSEPLGKRLRSIFPGHEFVLHLDDDGQLMRLDYALGRLDTLIYEREGDKFTGRQITDEPERLLAYKHGTIEHSLFVASQRAGLTDNLTMRLAQIFQWDVDFVLDIRPGDAFFVVYEELYHEDEYIGHGNILAAEFVNQGEHFRAIRYVDENGDGDYFAPDGNSMRKAFLRAPVEFSRISSNFNLRRVHPLFKTVRPHRGIDYSAPTGTPILASGDGRISKATRNKYNGNYVIIQHGEQFVTKYLHLSKFARGIRSGEKVKQGQVIGYVGATGYATGPHLHYEFLVNGVHKNPRTVSLPDAKPVGAEEMSRFKAQTAQYAALLDDYKHQIDLALAQ